MVDRLIEAVPYQVVDQFGFSPEDRRPRGLIEVGEGALKMGRVGSLFVSEGFISCTGLILRDRRGKKFGLFHTYDNDEPEKVDQEMLKRFQHGEVIVGEGSKGDNRTQLLKFLEAKFNIKCVGIIRVITVNPMLPDSPKNDSEPYNGEFNIAFPAGLNEIFIERLSYEDIQRFRAFD